MARVLIVGCGERGLVLASLLRDDGHAVRGTTRSEGRRAELEAAGVEPWIGDPDRIATIHYAMENATILCWMLASAEGSDESVAALHGTRLQMMLERTIDSTVRGVLYESNGSLPAEVLEVGSGEVERACSKNEIPWAMLTEPPDDPQGWAIAAKTGIDDLLTRDRG